LGQQKKKEESFFLFLHYLDAHAPYRAPQKIKAFGSTEKDRYDEILAFVDHHMGRVLRAVDDSGLRENTVVIVTSDHGEEFGEHGGKRHGEKLYEELTHVPLVMRIPGEAPRRIQSLVGGYDLMPTLLDVARIPEAKWPTLVGQSMLPLLDGEKKERVVFVENGRYRRKDRMNLALRQGDMKLIMNVRHNALELFDLGSDPGEQKNLAGQGHPAEKTLTDWGKSVRSRLRHIERKKARQGPVIRERSR
jgi:choline-sulfatase